MIVSTLMATALAAQPTPAEPMATPDATAEKKMACCEKMAKGDGCDCCKDMAKDGKDSTSPDLAGEHAH